MKESGITRLFLLVCVAVLLGAYGVGLGVRKIRFAGVETRASAAAVTKQPVAKSETGKQEATAKTSAVAEQPEEPSEQPQGEMAARPDRTEGRRMRGEGMGERFQNMSEEQRQDFMARMRERGGRRGGGSGGFSQLSEEDRERMRAEMEQLSARADEMSEEEMQQARRDVLEKYGITPRGGSGGGRFGGGESSGRQPGDRQ